MGLVKTTWPGGEKALRVPVVPSTAGVAQGGSREGRRGQPLTRRCPSQHILVAKRQISVATGSIEEFRQAFRSYTEGTAGHSSCLQ